MPTIPKPAIPEFTATLLTAPAEANKTIQLTIKNQPFTPYNDSTAGWVGLFYDVRAKEHGAANWTDLYLREDLPYLSENVPGKTESEYTVLSYPSLQPNSENTYRLGDKMMDFSLGSHVDFQVQALAGNIHRVWNPNVTNQLDRYPYVFTGEESGWSSTQTITIPSAVTTLTASPNPNLPTPTTKPTVPEFSSFAVLVLISAACLAVLALSKRNA